MPYKTKEEQAERDRIYYAKNRERRLLEFKARYLSVKAREYIPLANSERKILTDAENKLRGRIYVAEYNKKYPERTKAHIEVRRAIKKGILIRQPCSICGNIKSQAHHEDYSKPLEIQWLCQKHHKELHRRER